MNLPPDEACVLAPALRRQARERGAQVFVRFAEGGEWTYAQTLAQAERCAMALAQLGIRQGDRVFVWLPNCADLLRVWFGLNLLGAVLVPVNTAYKGALLAHVAENSGATLAIVHAGLASRFETGRTGALKRIVVLGGTAGAPDNIEVLGESVLDGGPASGLPEVRLHPWDLQAVVYTSGTTGPSKGVLTPYLQLAQMAVAGREMFTADDRRLVNLPLFQLPTVPNT